MGVSVHIKKRLDNFLLDISFESEAKRIGILGASGCGKSTLLKLLLRFWEKESGNIEYNGVDVDEIDSDNLLDNVTMVSQTTYLFDESIEDNLRIAKPDATQAELEAACKMASVHDFIMTLPDGYKTQAGAMGDNLSAGEKQRIGLARAFLKGSGLILLDEPTSNVDSINEGMILKRETLMDRIWTDGAEYVDENALSVTVKRLRDKLEAGKWIETIYGTGYRWVRVHG